MGAPEVACHYNHFAQGEKEEIYGACGEPDAPHAIRGIGQKEEGGHYAWDISPKSIACPKWTNRWTCPLYRILPSPLATRG